MLLKLRVQIYVVFILFASVLILTLESCSEESVTKVEDRIMELDVVEAQKAWGISLVGIGAAYENNGDYKTAAQNHLKKFYGFDEGKVLFKPTMAADKQFRNTFDGALSYFIGGNSSFAEDTGFALKKWKDVRWENNGIINSDCDLAIAMGNYYFTDPNGEVSKVEYTIAYRKNDQGQLKIVAHKSSIPFSI